MRQNEPIPVQTVYEVQFLSNEQQGFPVHKLISNIRRLYNVYDSIDLEYRVRKFLTFLILYLGGIYYGPFPLINTWNAAYAEILNLTAKIAESGEV